MYFFFFDKAASLPAPATVPVYPSANLINGDFNDLNGWSPFYGMIAELRGSGVLRLTKNDTSYYTLANYTLNNLTVGQVYYGRVSVLASNGASLYFSITGKDSTQSSIRQDTGFSFKATATSHTVELGIVGGNIGDWVELSQAAIYTATPAAGLYNANEELYDIGNWATGGKQELLSDGKIKLTRQSASSNYEPTRYFLRNLPTGISIPVKLTVSGYTSTTNQAVYAGIVGFGNYTLTSTGDITFNFTPTSDTHILEVGFFPLGGTLGDSFVADKLFVGTPQNSLPRLYKGQYTRANIYKGSKTDNQIYKGQQALFPV